MEPGHHVGADVAPGTRGGAWRDCAKRVPRRRWGWHGAMVVVAAAVVVMVVDLIVMVVKVVIVVGEHTTRHDPD